MMTGLLYLEDGSVYRGKGFGAAATKVGELDFNTSMSGYQELLTDPAATGLIVNMTYPLIGNYGISEIDNQSDRVRAFGLVTRDISFRPSNRCSVTGISEWLLEQGVPGIYNVDTRAITKKIRMNGACKCVISTEGISKDRALELLVSTELKADYMKSAGVDENVQFIGTEGNNYKVAVIDFGIRQSTLDALICRGCEVILMPYGAAADDILAMKPDGLLLSDGPGAPGECEAGIKAASDLMGKIPLFGIGMGHLVVALAAGGRTYKLKHGHRGAGQAVKDALTGRTAITSQNHGYAVDADSLADSGLTVSHINLNDGSVEGLRHERFPAFTIAYAPEGRPGPNDSEVLYNDFVKMMYCHKLETKEGGGTDAQE